MRRRLFNLAAAVSLVLCVATVGLWVRSYWHIDGVIWWWRGDFAVGPASGPGSFFVGYSREQSLPGTPTLQWVTIPVSYPLAPPAPIVFEFAGFGYYRSNLQHSVRVPLAAMVMAFVFIAWYCARKGRQHAAGLCPTCGYDLRASPERCPECGTAVTRPTPRQAVASASPVQ